MHKTIFRDICGVLGMTPLIIIRIEQVNFTLRVVLALVFALLCVIACVFATQKNIAQKLKETTCLNLLHETLFISYVTILVLLMIK